MRVEATLIQRTIGYEKNDLRSEAKAWARLFDRKFIDRTLIGVFIMFFQRTFVAHTLARDHVLKS